MSTLTVAPTPTSKANPTATSTMIECFVYSTDLGGTVHWTPAYPIATGAHCYVLDPNTGLIVSAIPNSEAWPMNTLPAYTQTAHVTPSADANSAATSKHSLVGPIVGSVLGVAFFAGLAGLVLYKLKKQKAAASKRQWALRPGKWIVEEPKSNPLPMPVLQNTPKN